MRAHAAAELALGKAATAPDAEAQLTEAIKLIVALQHKLRSPAAARSLRARIRAVPAAHARVRKMAPRSSADTQRQLRAQLGESARHLPTRLGAATPPGTIRATRVIDPSGNDRARARVQTPIPGRHQGAKR